MIQLELKIRKLQQRYQSLVHNPMIFDEDKKELEIELSNTINEMNNCITIPISENTDILTVDKYFKALKNGE